jgi:hypothetical protein
MSWKAITEYELMVHIDRSLGEAEPAVRAKFIGMRIPIRALPCSRGARQRGDFLYAVAQSGRKVIAFDDVEDEFAIVSLPEASGEVLSEWTLVGTLAAAVNAI